MKMIACEATSTFFLYFSCRFGAESVVWRPRKKKSIRTEPINYKDMTVDAADLDVYEYL
jgi:hypothetical protein